MHKRAPEYLSIYVDDKLKRGIKEVRPACVGLLCCGGCVPLSLSSGILLSLIDLIFCSPDD
jgi:hypothetical protein